MKHVTLAVLLLLTASTLFAQKYISRSGKVTFFSSTPLENIEAFNNEAGSVVDVKTGDIVFQVPIRSFKFEKALMQEHFNENYMESAKYPKAEYKGKITNLGSVNFAKDGTYDVQTAGKMTIHGVTKDVKIPGTITVKGNSITSSSKFKAKTADYKITIPKLMEGKIAKEVEVTINSIMEKR